MPGCSARFCTNRSEGGFLMHVVPKDPQRRAQWASKVKTDSWKPNKSYYLCEAHFDRDQFELKRRDGKIKLKPFAVPTLFHYTANKPAREPRFVRESRVWENLESVTPFSTDTSLDSASRMLLKNDLCNAKNCMSAKSDTPLMLFPFPDDEDRCQEWVRRCQNEALVGIPASELCQNAHLCLKHFDESQFLNSMKEELVEDALPSIFPHHFVSVPSFTPTSQDEDWSESPKTVKSEPLGSNTEEESAVNKASTSDLTYQELCALASEVKLPSSLWAVHKGLSNEFVAFVHTNISDPFIQADKAVVFNKTCRAAIYFKGQRILMGMDMVTTLTELETLLTGLNSSSFSI